MKLETTKKEMGWGNGVVYSMFSCTPPNYHYYLPINFHTSYAYSYVLIRKADIKSKQSTISKSKKEARRIDFTVLQKVKKQATNG